IGSGDTNARDVHGLAVANVLVEEAGGSVAGREDVGCDAVVRERNGGVSGAVINLVHARGGDGECGLGDIGRCAGVGVGVVVARIGSRDTNARDVHGLAVANVLVQEIGGSIAGREDVGCDAIVRERDGRVSGGVVDLVHARGGDGECGFGDVGRCAGVGVGVVVARIGSR